MFIQVTIAILVCFIAATVLIYLLIPLAKRIGLVDQPGGRKQHYLSTPLIGGAAMFVALSFGSLLLPMSLQPFRAFFAASILLVFIGVMDDLRELSAKSRLLVQIIAGIFMVAWGGVSLHNLGNLFFIGEIHLDYTAGLIISICAVIGVTNAINMLDGVDGLVGTITLLQFLFLIYLALMKGYLIHVGILVLFVPVILEFLWFNFSFPWRKHARIFMGDAGSMFLGFSLVWFSIYLSQAPHRVASPVVFLWIMTVPLFDIGATLFRRILRGRSPFKPDRGHIHHLLLQLGLSKLVIVVILGSATIAFGLYGVIMDDLGWLPAISFFIFIIFFILYVIVTEIIWHILKDLK